MIFFEEIDVTINGTGILAETAQINSSNATIPLRALGYHLPLSITNNGPISSTISLSYYPIISGDPSLGIVRGLKENYQDTYTGFQVAIGGITGNCFLTQYSLGFTPNDITTASASYQSFQPISGSLIANSSSPNYDKSKFSGISHGTKVFFENSGDLNSNPVYSLNYSFEANWLPIYSMISGTATRSLGVPSQVQLIEAKESFSIVKDVFSHVLLTGESLTGNLNKKFIYINNLASGYTSTNNEFSEVINLSGAVIESVSLDSSVSSDFVRVTINATKYY